MLCVCVYICVYIYIYIYIYVVYYNNIIMNTLRPDFTIYDCLKIKGNQEIHERISLMNLLVIFNL